jgi:biotin carboxyl carrier protein
MKTKFTIKKKDYEIEIVDVQNDDIVKVVVNGREFFFKKENQAKDVSVPQTLIPKRDFSSKVVKAAIAGTVTEVFVKEGDLVKAGQKLLTLAAMKMENEIVSDIEGKIKEAKVKQGDCVKEGDILIILN